MFFRIDCFGSSFIPKGILCKNGDFSLFSDTFSTLSGIGESSRPKAGTFEIFTDGV